MKHNLRDSKYRLVKGCFSTVITISLLPFITGYAQETQENSNGSKANILYLPLVSTHSTVSKWTLMVYLDGDNDLEINGVDSFLQMSSVDSTSEVNVLVQFDRIRLPMLDDTRYGDWTDAKRYRITKGMTPTPINALQDLGEVNMADPQTLIDFVDWGFPEGIFETQLDRHRRAPELNCRYEVIYASQG